MAELMTAEHTRSMIEALILASPEPLPTARILQVVPDLTPTKVGNLVGELNNRYMESGTSFRIREIAGGYQFYILSDYMGFVEELFARRRKMRLTRAALETVAIVAYKQPVTKAEIEQIRGVASDGVLNTLLEKNMIVISGRAKTVGKPLQYGTAEEFLKFFGLNTLDDLPKMKEIEELIAAAEQRSQTELRLPDPLEEEARMQKLNVADGTFDPRSRDEEAEFEDGEDETSRISITLRKGPEETRAHSEEPEVETAE